MRLRAAALACIFTVSVAVAGLPMMASAASVGTDVVETFEKIGRFGCLGLMVLVIPGCGFRFSSDKAFAAYIILDILLSAAYCLLWIVLFKKNNVFRALALSVIPSLLFLVSGVLSHYWPLCIAAAVFVPSHIAVSYKNAVLETQR